MTADHLGAIPVNGDLLPAGHGFEVRGSDVAVALVPELPHVLGRPWLAEMRGEARRQRGLARALGTVDGDALKHGRPPRAVR